MVSWKSSHRKYTNPLVHLHQNIISISLKMYWEWGFSKQNKRTKLFTLLMEKNPKGYILLRRVFLGFGVCFFSFPLSLEEDFFKVWCGAGREIVFKLRNLLLLVLCLHSFKNRFWYLWEWGIALLCDFLPDNRLIRCQVLNAEFNAFKGTLMKTKEFGIWIACVCFWKHVFFLRLQNNDNL